MKLFKLWMVGAAFLLLIGCMHHAAAGQAPQADTVYVDVKAVAGLQYDKVRFQVVPEAPVQLTLTNTSDMGHNLVITAPEKRTAVVEAAENTGPEDNYVPDTKDVLVHTPVLKSDGSFELTFTAPKEKGVYPYVCTYPGHGIVMYGAMYVGQEMPPLAEDVHVPEKRRKKEQPADQLSAGHPYTVDLPAVYRTFMPESSPASIAVGLPGGQSYCFDASFSYLRYAWQGGFIDNTKQWQGNGVSFSKIIGDIYYRNDVGFPFRIGNREQAPQAVEFKGYRLVGEGQPEFRYSVDGVEVRELIKTHADGNGLVREFTIEKANQTVWFVAGADAGVEYESSAGQWTESYLQLSPEEAERFTITMVNRSNETDG